MIPKQIQIGTPGFVSISQGPGIMCPGDYAIFNVSATGNNVTYNWTYDTNTLELGTYPTGTGPQWILKAKVNFNTGFVKVTLSNSCGTADQYGFWTVGRVYQGRSSSYTAYPNPATDQLTVSAPDDASNADKNSVSGDAVSTTKAFEIKFYDNKGKIWSSGKNKALESSIAVDTHNIPRGTYFLHIIEGKTVIKEQIVIEH